MVRLVLFHFVLFDLSDLSFVSSLGFSQTVPEAAWVIPTLWKTTLDFIRDSKARERGWIKEGNEDNWLDLISDDGGKTYNLR